MDGGAWWAVVHGVSRSQTRRTDFTFTFHFHALEKEIATHFSILAWRIPGTGEPGGLLYMGSHRVGHDWHNLATAENFGKVIHEAKNKGDPLGRMRSLGDNDAKKTFHCTLNVDWLLNYLNITYMQKKNKCKNVNVFFSSLKMVHLEGNQEPEKYIYVSHHLCLHTAKSFWITSK